MRDQEIAKRTDVSKLTVEEMFLRRAIDKTPGIAIIQYQHVGTLDKRELWFDAYVWITGAPGEEWPQGLVDLIPSSSGEKTHRNMRRKVDYADMIGLPLLQVRANSATRGILRVWVMKVRMDHDK